MKGMKVTHNQVLANLSHFRRFLQERGHSGRKKKDRSYSVWMNRETGEMEFERKKGMPITTKKELRLLVHEKHSGAVHFKLKGNFSREEQMIRSVAEETMRILNLLALFTERILPEERVVKDLSSVHLEAWKDSIELFPGWHADCERIEAEKILKGAPIGTYILRKCEQLSQWMLKQYPIHTKGYILTAVESGKKISDYMIVKTERGWTLLQDDPDLIAYDYYITLYELLENLNHIAMHPKMNR